MRLLTPQGILEGDWLTELPDHDAEPSPFASMTVHGGCIEEAVLAAVEAHNAAPYCDEPVTEAEERAAADARADIEAGRVTSHEDLLRELGLDERD